MGGMGPDPCSMCRRPATADPSLTRQGDGTVTVNWPEDEPDVALITREAMLNLVEDYNRVRRVARALDGSAPMIELAQELARRPGGMIADLSPQVSDV